MVLNAAGAELACCKPQAVNVSMRAFMGEKYGFGASAP